MAKKKNKLGKLDLSAMKDLVNTVAGVKVAHDLTQENPTEVVDWIPTGSRWLDSIICRGCIAGIPIGRISELAGLQSTGKSYMAAQIAAEAQKKDIFVIYFDSESAIDPEFLTKAGCDLSKLLYVQARSVEFVLETIETVIGSSDGRVLFILDSLAFTPAISDLEGDYDPNSTVAVKPRVLAKGLQKLILPIANAEATFLVLNQLKTNIGVRNAKYASDSELYNTPGGKALNYAYSLRVWLTGRTAKASFVEDDKGFRVGSTVKARLEKSRFGSQYRRCFFQILWGDEVGIMDEESWLEAISTSDHITVGAWNTLHWEDGRESKKFRKTEFVDMLKDEDFKVRVLELMDEEVVLKFHKREANAADFYDQPKEKEE